MHKLRTRDEIEQELRTRRPDWDAFPDTVRTHFITEEQSRDNALCNAFSLTQNDPAEIASCSTCSRFSYDDTQFNRISGKPGERYTPGLVLYKLSMSDGPYSTSVRHICEDCRQHLVLTLACPPTR
jgi:hypothetical protein